MTNVATEEDKRDTEDILIRLEFATSDASEASAEWDSEARANLLASCCVELCDIANNLLLRLDTLERAWDAREQWELEQSEQ